MFATRRINEHQVYYSGTAFLFIILKIKLSLTAATTYIHPAVTVNLRDSFYC
jgi:hypothetical protein